VPLNNRQTERAHIRTQHFCKEVTRKYLNWNAIEAAKRGSHSNQRGTPSDKSQTGERNSLLCLVEEVCRIRTELFEKLVDCSASDISRALARSKADVTTSCAVAKFRHMHSVDNDSKATGLVKEPSLTAST
jgi:hypothetical protein